MSAALTVWIWTRNTLLGELLTEAVQMRGLTARHHDHPDAPPPEEARIQSLMVVGPEIGDKEVFLWRQLPPPMLMLLRELAVDETTQPAVEPASLCLHLPLDLMEFHRCLDLHAMLGRG